MAVRFSDGTSDTTTPKHLNASGINGLVEQNLTTRAKSTDYAGNLIEKLCFDDDSDQKQWNNGNVFIEVSLEDGSGNRVSKKLDFGKILRYLSDAIDTLGNNVKSGYLTQTEANTLYVRKEGDTMSGTLTISSSPTALNITKGNINCDGSITATGITSNTTIRANAGLTANGIVSKGRLTANGNTTLSVLSVINDATFNGNLTNEGGPNIKANFSNVNIAALSVDTLSSNTTTLSGDTTSTGNFKSNGSTTLSGDTTVKGDVKLEESGSLYLTDNSKIYAGNNKSAPSIGKDDDYINISKAKIDEATINTAIIGNNDSTSTVLTINGSAICTTTRQNPNAKFLTTNLGVENTATFNNEVHALKFKASDGYYLSGGTASTYINTNDGLVQTTPTIVNITAKQACWA